MCPFVLTEAIIQSRADNIGGSKGEGGFAGLAAFDKMKYPLAPLFYSKTVHE